MNPFELHGPAYLTFYICTVTAAGFIAVLVRHAFLSGGKSQDIGRASMAGQLNAYEVAYLSGGSERAFASACGALARHNLLKVNTVTRTLSAGESFARPKLHDLEQAIMACVGTAPMAINKVQEKVGTNLASIQARLVNYGLVPALETKGAALFLPWFIFIGTVMTFSLPKIAMANAQRLPHGYLIMLMFLFMLASVCFFKPVRNTREGDRVNASLAESNSALRLTAATNPRGLSLSDTALAYGLFGAVALAGDPFADALQGLRAVRADSVGSGGGCGSGSSCGGGGCGGGGCGGGGCGG